MALNVRVFKGYIGKFKFATIILGAINFGVALKLWMGNQLEDIEFTCWKQCRIDKQLTNSELNETTTTPRYSIPVRLEEPKDDFYFVVVSAFFAMSCLYALMWLLECISLSYRTNKIDMVFHTFGGILTFVAAIVSSISLSQYNSGEKEEMNYFFKSGTFIQLHSGKSFPGIHPLSLVQFVEKIISLVLTLLNSVAYFGTVVFLYIQHQKY